MKPISASLTLVRFTRKMLFWEFLRLALPDGAFSGREDALSYEDHYAILADALTTQNRWNVFRSMGCVIVLLLGDAREGGQSVQLQICFLPKSRASIDQAPGPIIANVPPRTARIIDTDSSPAPVKAIHTCTTATSAPTAGVHKPARIKNPRTLPVNSGTIGPTAATPRSTVVPW